MKILLPILFFITLSIGNLLGNELLKNGDISRGSSGWKGDRKIISIADNKLIEVKVSNKSIRSFTQEEIKCKGLKDVTLIFRYRASKDYNGRGMTVRFRKENYGTIYSSSKIVNDGNWHDYKWEFDQIKDSKKLDLIIEIKEGAGTVYFDDFSLVPN